MPNRPGPQSSADQDSMSFPDTDVNPSADPPAVPSTDPPVNLSTGPPVVPPTDPRVNLPTGPPVVPPANPPTDPPVNLCTDPPVNLPVVPPVVVIDDQSADHTSPETSLAPLLPSLLKIVLLAFHVVSLPRCLLRLKP